MRINLIEMDEAKKRISVYYDAPIFVLFKERIMAFCAYTILRGVGNNGMGINFGTWYNQATMMPVDAKQSVELDKFARGCATAKGLIG